MAVSTGLIMVCALKALGSDMKMEMDSLGKFKLIITGSGQAHACVLHPVEVNALRVDDVPTTGIAFSSDMNCTPELPEGFSAGFNQDMEIQIQVKTVKFFVINHEPAVACKTEKLDYKQVKIAAERLRAQLAKAPKK